MDDVLVLSKVDANLIEIAPVDTRPQDLVGSALRMFAAELAANNAEMSFVTEQSFTDLEVDRVFLDPSRLMQVLINLCTNAIKFTNDSSVRNITISLGASIMEPIQSSYGIQYLQRTVENKMVDPTSRQDWGSGEPLFLHFQVKDTGRGMTTEEMKLLFKRFSQTSHRTHTQYGGSGLGLFIARLLTQLQGGDIGVASTPEHGSTFAFYIKVRRVIPPVDPITVPTILPTTNLAAALEAKKNGAHPTVARNCSEFAVLVVEDNLVNQKVLGRQLRNVGFTVHIANNGREAIEFLKDTKLWKSNEENGRDLSFILMDIGKMIKPE